jgi:hypothetical protein
MVRAGSDVSPDTRRPIDNREHHGVFAPNHRLRSAVTTLAIRNISKRCDVATRGQASGEHAMGGCCDANQNTTAHDTSRIAWAKLIAREGDEFPLECPKCGGDIRLISFITEPGARGS